MIKIFLMGKSSMPCVWYLVMLSVCIDQGDGRWKERDKENFQHDIIAYKRIAEKLDREIEAFYDEYPNEWLKGDDVDRIHYKYLTKILNRNTEITKNTENTDEEKHTFPFVSSETDVAGTTEPTTTDTSRLVQNDSNKYKATDWPTFQDILLAIGRKYDWKNDRWIKVREKPKDNISVSFQHDNEVSVSERHKFSYRIVKLKKSKSRRNVVVAVSAVR